MNCQWDCFPNFFFWQLVVNVQSYNRFQYINFFLSDDSGLFLLLKTYLLIFIFGCVVSIAVCRLFPRCGEWRLHSSCSVGFFPQRLLLLQSTGSRELSLHQLQPTGSKVGALVFRSAGSSLWSTGLVALWHVESSQTRDRTCVSYTVGFVTIGPPGKSFPYNLNDCMSGMSQKIFLPSLAESQT